MQYMLFLSLFIEQINISKNIAFISGLRFSYNVEA